MLRSRHLLALAPARSWRTATVLLAVVASCAGAQGSTPPGILHVAASRFEFVTSGDTQPEAKKLAVHNGGTTRLTDIRLTRVAYADSARGAAWLVALPRQSALEPNELAAAGLLCVDAAGLLAGTYLATAAVAAREVPEPVAITITLVVMDDSARLRQSATRCAPVVTK